MRLPACRSSLLLLLCLPLLGTSSLLVAGIAIPPSILTVGNTQNCDHNSIEDAIGAAAAEGNTIIRISNNVGHTNQALLIVNRNIELRGGYPGCDLAAPANARTIIRGNGVDSVISINATGAARTVILRNLVIREGGSSDALNERGGGVRVRGLSQVEVRNSHIGDNESHDGAGIHIAGASATLLLDDNSIIGLVTGLPANRAVANGPAAVRGGGLSCSGATVTILDARFRNNTSEGDGGGLHAVDCAILIAPRPDFVEGENGADGFVTFFENRADVNGGAIRAQDTQIEWRSAQSGGRFAGRAFGNVAGNSGGAVHLTGADSQFTADWVRFEGNDASNEGGAVRVSDEAGFILRGVDGMQCNYTTCPAIVESGFDGPDSAISGGALVATSGAQVVLRQTVLARNVASLGSAVFATQAGTRITLKHVLVHQNFLTGENNISYPIQLFSGADAELIHLTMFANLRPGGILFQPPVASIGVIGAGTTATIANSLLVDDGLETASVFNGGVASGSCILSHEDVTLPGITIGDADYVAPFADPPEFAPGPGSFALDRCASAEMFEGGSILDLYGRPRPVDLFEAGGGEGTWDMGAIEIQSVVVAVGIFRDGFEE